MSSAAPAPPATGLSPRGRGNRWPSRPTSGRPWSIPAWAGEPEGGHGGRGGAGVYPRVGGGTADTYVQLMVAMGLSPRGRGNQSLQLYRGATAGSIPAWAGEPLSSSGVSDMSQVYPRVGGGTLHDKAMVDAQKGLSPRGRGNRRLRCQPRPARWSIPAWAGEPPNSRVRKPPTTVYPRVGGGTPFDNRQQPILGGLSPRGRGNPHRLRFSRPIHRSIPAWAGEPYRRGKM